MFWHRYIYRLLGLFLLTLPLSPALAAADSALETPVAAHLPDGVEYTHAQGSPHIRTLRQDANTPRAVIDWQSFNIGEDATVIFDQQAGNNSITVNRVVGGGTDPSNILGKLAANGTVVILDSNGVIFGKSAVIDVGGIVASTGTLADTAAFLDSGTFTLTGTDSLRADATVENLSHRFTVRDAGLAAFVAPIVSNHGTITARMGYIRLASGAAATLDFYGDRLLNITAPLTQPLPAGRSQVENTGSLIADGGRVTLTARAAAAVVDQAINTSGIVSAQKAGIENGKIVLSGADGIEDIRENSILIGTNAKLQKAVDMAAGDGSTTIHMQAGKYEENVVIDKSVTITGIRGRVSIVAQDESNPALHVKARNVTLSNLTIVGGLNNLLAESAKGISLLTSDLVLSISDAIRLVNTSIYHFIDNTILHTGGADITHETTSQEAVPDDNRIFTNAFFGRIFGSSQKSTPDTPGLTTAETLAQIAPAGGGDNGCENSSTGCAE